MLFKLLACAEQSHACSLLWDGRASAHCKGVAVQTDQGDLMFMIIFSSVGKPFVLALSERGVHQEVSPVL